jgi:intracellular septation protein A
VKIAKLIIGIISIVLTFLIMFQSCAASVGDALANKGGTGGSAGIFVAILMLIAGIVAIVARSSKGGGIVSLIFYAIAGIIGLTSHGIYKDLIIWGVVNLIFACIFLIATITFKKPDKPLV